MKEAIAILTGGGPAPGINTVVGSVAKVFLRKGYRVIGLNDGYDSLFTETPKITEIDFHLADNMFQTGGSLLRVSRYKPSQEDIEQRFNLDLFTKNNVKLLVTIGGDDTASTANRIAKFLEEKKYSISNIHVPKTIDNDLPLPQGTPTFGYESAKNGGAKIASIIYEDARTSQNWFVVTAMGRSAGHLTFGIGSACHYPMIIIPEMFYKTTISIDKIVNLAVSSIIKRRMFGTNYGAVIISEGVFENLSNDEIEKSGICFTYDDHGHPELGKLSKAHIFCDLVDKKIAALGLKIKTRPVEIGYEVRCEAPIAFDCEYCTLMGLGVYQLFKEGLTGCMVYINQEGQAQSLFLKDLQDPVTGKIPPRLVDIESARVQNVLRRMMSFIHPGDYEAARKYVPNPEEFDFFKILNW